MGKIHCEACKKSCKGKAVRLQEKYFHVKCFKCKQCEKQLAAGGFYAKDNEYYCSEDYQKLFGTKCAACNKFVEGEVITALGNTYHQNCFACTKCGNKFSAGDKVTFSNKDYLCNRCLDEVDHKSPKKSPTKGRGTNGVPSVSSVKGGPITSTPGKAEINHLGSPTSDMSDFSDTPIHIVTEQQGQGDLPYNGPFSPLSNISDADDSVFSPRRLDAEFSSYFNNDDSFLRPPSEDHPDGNLTTNDADCRLSDSLRKLYNSVSNAFCPPGARLQAGGQKGRLSPVQQMLQYRSPSPVGSTVSRTSHKSRDSSGRASRQSEPDYGRFYKANYLEQAAAQPFKKGPSINPNFRPTSPHYHRPADYFSYRQVHRDFMRPVKKGMLSTFAGEEYKTKRNMDSIVPMGKEEAIRMSKYPDAHKPDVPRPLPIERDDWPAPPAPAAAYPELLRSHPLGRGRSEPALEDDRTDGPMDPKIQREIEELKKIHDSGLGQVFIKDLSKKRHTSPPLDPRSASRTPAANREPPYKTRYESPIFASPSRDLDYRPRLHSMDDELIGKKYRSTTPISNFPVEPFQYESAKSLVSTHGAVPKPGYSRGSGSKSATLPTESRNGGYFGEYEHQAENGSTEGLSRRSYHTSQSSVEEYDPETGLRKTRSRAASATRSMSASFSTPAYMSFRRSIPSLWKPEEPPRIYAYEQLLITNEQLPPDVDRNNAEVHLSKEDFEVLFRMSREEFYRLAEWKRNDLKRRVCLF